MSIEDFNGSVIKRRRFSTKDCPECDICSNNVFEICHPHVSSLDILSKARQQNGLVYCPMCKVSHHPQPQNDSKHHRLRVIMGSSDLHNLWQVKSFKPEVHIDFDIIIGGRIHDSHESFILQYINTIKCPINLILVCGINNIPTFDSAKDVIFQFESFLRTFWKHSKKNRIFICPIVFAPKFCDNRLLPTQNHLQKILEINHWIRKFNKSQTKISYDLSMHGVMKLPTNVDQGVEHDYSKWREPNWRKKLHLTNEAKEAIAVEMIKTFEQMDEL